jgi:transcription elongation GreA/GreB family factor
MFFNFATKEDINALSRAHADAYAKTSLRIQLLEDRINSLESDLKNTSQYSVDRYASFCLSVEAKVQAALQNLRAHYDLSMSAEDKNHMRIKRLESRIFDLARK